MEAVKRAATQRPGGKTNESPSSAEQEGARYSKKPSCVANGVVGRELSRSDAQFNLQRLLAMSVTERFGEHTCLSCEEPLPA